MQIKFKSLDRETYCALCKVVEMKDITYAVGSDAPRCVDAIIDMGNIYSIRAVGAFGTVILENYHTHDKVVISDRKFGSVSII